MYCKEFLVKSDKSNFYQKYYKIFNKIKSFINKYLYIKKNKIYKNHNRGKLV